MDDEVPPRDAARQGRRTYELPDVLGVPRPPPPPPPRRPLLDDVRQGVTVALFLLALLLGSIAVVQLATGTPARATVAAFVALGVVALAVVLVDRRR